MPSIGSLTFPIDDGLDSGIAFLLSKPPEKELTLRYRDYQILAAPDTPFVICRFAGAVSLEDAFRTGSLVAQEALDILSMTGNADLITREADDEYLAWWCSEDGRTMAQVSTITLSVTLGHATVTVQDANGNVVPSTPVIPKHHIGFRFYRLSQVSDDLYDAYRNMYLAFESILSSQYPKSKGLEINWLRQSLNAAASDLQLSNLIPVGVADPTGYLLAKIYDGARLPLFHAKDGKAYFAPVQSSINRQEVSTSLAILTQIVIRMAGKWFAARRLGGWVNLALLAEQNEKLQGATSALAGLIQKVPARFGCYLGLSVRKIGELFPKVLRLLDGLNGPNIAAAREGISTAAESLQAISAALTDHAPAERTVIVTIEGSDNDNSALAAAVENLIVEKGKSEQARLATEYNWVAGKTTCCEKGGYNDPSGLLPSAHDVSVHSNGGAQGGIAELIGMMLGGRVQVIGL